SATTAMAGFSTSEQALRRRENSLRTCRDMCSRWSNTIARSSRALMPLNSTSRSAGPARVPGAPPPAAPPAAPPRGGVAGRAGARARSSAQGEDVAASTTGSDHAQSLGGAGGHDRPYDAQSDDDHQPFAVHQYDLIYRHISLLCCSSSLVGFWEGATRYRRMR